jgi:exodeoxyribonuclease-1
MSQIPNDYLPHPAACLVTGITPQKSLRQGMLESDFAQKVFAHMSVPNTCSLGYNSMRFDDEVTRFLFYRNFLDPYAREWQNGNSRWDLIDVARACYALRPDGISWPSNEEGAPSFKLENLTAANNIEHSGAHDALADVRATIAFAKLIKEKQPKLFDYALSLRNKQFLWSLINFQTLTPLLHISAKIPSSQACCTWILPIAAHPSQKNAVICIDLSKPVDVLLDQSIEELKHKLYAKKEALSHADMRPGIKLLHLNKSPFITSAKALSEERAEQIGLNRKQCLDNYKMLSNNTQCFSKIIELFNDTPEFETLPVEQRLYCEGFMSNQDREVCQRIHTSTPEHLANLGEAFSTSTLKSLFKRYRGRNFPSTLAHDELVEWQQHRHQQLTEGKTGLTITSFSAEIDRLVQLHSRNPEAMQILKALHRYVQNL